MKTEHPQQFTVFPGLPSLVRFPQQGQLNSLILLVSMTRDVPPYQDIGKSPWTTPQVYNYYPQRPQQDSNLQRHQPRRPILSWGLGVQTRFWPPPPAPTCQAELVVPLLYPFC